MKLNVLKLTQSFYKRKLKLKLHVETKAVADAATVNHHHQLDLYIKAHRLFQFRFQHLNLQKDVQLGNVSLIEHVFGILFLTLMEIKIASLS